MSVAVNETDRAAAIANMVVPYGIYIEDYSDVEQGAMDIAHISVASGLIDEELLARDRTCAVIHLYFPPEENPAEAAAFLRERMEACGIKHEIDLNSVLESDWANGWKKYFTPLPTGERIMICPTWTPVPDCGGRKVLHIDPGMAFGTGGHDTTRLVLGMMEQYIADGDNILDIGCGSGILSIAALLLGGQQVLGIDIDPVAVRTAKENGQLNGMSPPQYNMRLGDLAADVMGQYAVVTANIVADAIIALSPEVPRFLALGGVYIVSGIIDTREQDVLKAVAAVGFCVRQRMEQGGWVCLALELCRVTK